MPPRVRILTLTLLVGLLLGLESRAFACACCDRSSWQRVTGWDERGNALVDALENPGCSPKRRLEVWRPGATGPQECIRLDVPGDVTVDCSAAQYGERSSALHWSKRRTEFGRPVRVLAARDVWASLEVPSGNDYYESSTLEVRIRSGKDWVLVHRSKVHLGFMADTFGIENIGVGVFPSPDGTQALLLVDGFDQVPGMGDYRSQLTWIALPPDAAGRAETVPWKLLSDIRQRTIADTYGKYDAEGEALPGPPRIAFAAGVPRIALPRFRQQGADGRACFSEEKSSSSATPTIVLKASAARLYCSPWLVESQKALLLALRQLGLNEVAEAHGASAQADPVP